MKEALFYRLNFCRGPRMFKQTERAVCSMTKTEWSLVSEGFKFITESFGQFEIDLFASRLNFKLQPYSLWKPDPTANFVDAFSASWANL